METLPTEMLTNICESLDDKSLKRLMETNWKYYNACHQIWQRKVIKLSSYDYFEKDQTIIYITYLPEGILLQQYDQGLQEEPWPFPWLDPKIDQDELGAYHLRALDGHEKAFRIFSALHESGFSGHLKEQKVKMPELRRRTISHFRN